MQQENEKEGENKVFFWGGYFVKKGSGGGWGSGVQLVEFQKYVLFFSFCAFFSPASRMRVGFLYDHISLGFPRVPTLEVCVQRGTFMFQVLFAFLDWKWSGGN